MVHKKPIFLSTPELQGTHMLPTGSVLYDGANNDAGTKLRDDYEWVVWQWDDGGRICEEEGKWRYDFSYPPPFKG